MSELLSVDHLIVLTNVALVIVTALAIRVTLKDSHKHEEEMAHSSEHVNDALAGLVHDVLVQEGRILADADELDKPERKVHAVK